MDAIQQNLLEQVAGLHEIPAGAYNIRANGQMAARNTTANIDITTKEDHSGIDIRTGGVVGWPVICVKDGILARVSVSPTGCGIHNSGGSASEHSGIHRFFVEKNAKVRYVEKHYGSGDGSGERLMNPTTEIHLAEGASLEMDTVQIKGIDSTKRVTTAQVAEGSSLVIREKIMTHGRQYAETDFSVDMNGDDSSVNLISRSVAKEHSRQLFKSRIVGNGKCQGHSECDAIIMDEASVSAVPELTANNIDANLIHEAAIGKIAGEQLMKLMTLGLTEKEAEEQIVNGFLK